MQQSTKQRALLIAIALFIVALAVRIVNLDQFLTTDEPEGWLGKSMDFAQALLTGQLAGTFQHYSPGVTLMWSGSLGLYLAYLASPAATFADFLRTVPFDPVEPGLVFWFRLPNVIIGAACIALGYPFAQKLLGLKIALAGSLLLAFDPLFIGMNRVLGHDGLAASLMMVSALAAMVFFTSEKPGYGALALSAIAAGLAILAKSTAFFMLPFVGFISITIPLYRRAPGQLKQNLLHLLAWGLGVGLTFVIFWPALWVAPVTTLQEMVQGLQQAAEEPHNRGSFFWGQPVPDPGPTFYWIAAYFRLTAITTIGLILGGAYFLTAGKRGSGDSRQYTLGGYVSQTKLSLILLYAFIIFYLAFLSFGSKKQDRYITPILPMASLAAGAGYVWLAGQLPRPRWQNVALAGVVAGQGAIAWGSAPYFLTHYNLLAGGSRVAPHMLLVGWGEGLDLAAGYLNRQPDSDTLRVSAWYHSAFEPYFRGQAVETAGDEKISRSPKPALAAQYVVLYINQIQRQMPTPGLIQYYQSFPPAHVVAINGIDYAAIYPSPNVARIFSGQVRLVGQAELLGFNLLNGQGERVSQLPADQSATIQLFWEWQGKSPADPIALNLIDRQGLVWGQLDPLGSRSPIPFQNWAEGALVYDDFRLTLLPGAPPGTYYLKAWIDRPATGERVGDFPLALEDAPIQVTRPASPPAPAELPLTTRLNRSLTSNITLLGYTFTPLTNSINSINSPWQPDETRDLVLYWQADAAITQNHPLRLALIDATGLTRAEWTGLPAGGNFPTDQWQPGDIIRDPWALTLPSYVPPGNYRLTVTLGQEPPLDLLTMPVAGRPRLFDAPPPALALQAGFGESIKLLGLNAPAASESSLEITPGQPLTIELIWQADALVEADYTITAQLLDGEQQVRAQKDRMPLDGAAPTTTWAVGEVLPDAFTLDIPPDIGPAPYRLLIALYRLETGERLRLPNGADHLTIPVRLVNSK